jgi:predicted RNA binding protein YcfA (HicA-like mRNA interferase family)
MSGQVPVLSGKDVRKAFENDGWELARQRGSHMILVKEGSMATLSVPNHKTVAKGTLRSLIRAAGLTVDEFLSLTK